MSALSVYTVDILKASCLTSQQCNWLIWELSCVQFLQTMETNWKIIDVIIVKLVVKFYTHRKMMDLIVSANKLGCFPIGN